MRKCRAPAKVRARYLPTLAACVCPCGESSILWSGRRALTVLSRLASDCPWRTRNIRSVLAGIVSRPLDFLRNLHPPGIDEQLLERPLTAHDALLARKSVV